MSNRGGHKPRIILESVDPEREADAGVELNETAQGAAPPLIAIMIVADIHEAFGRYFPGANIINSSAYGQTREMSGLARTLAIRIDSEVGFVIGVNASVVPEAFVEWKDEERPYREYTVWHEITHIQDMAMQVYAEGINSFISMFESQDPAEIARHNAHMLWWEYHACRYVTASMTGWFRGAHLWSHVHALDQGYHDQLQEYLNDLPGSRLQDPRKARVVLDAIPYLWAAVMGFEDGSVPVPDGYKHTSGYRLALDPDAARIRQLLEQMYTTTGRYRGDLLADLSALLFATRKRARKLADEPRE